jgi:predicted MFS family arabinose efflux permease
VIESIRHGVQDPSSGVLDDLADPGRVRRARVAVTTVFVVNGAVFASWIARVPALRDTFELSGTALGLLLLCVSVGSVAALPSSGSVVHVLGPARTVLLGSVLVSVGLAVAAVGIAAGVVALTAVSLVGVGAGTAVWDVAMNVEGADVERRVNRPIMSGLHGGFSIGTVCGAGLGALCAAAGVPLAAQLAVVAPLSLLLVMLAVRRFLPIPAAASSRDDSGTRSAWRAWREPRTLLLGLMVLGFAFTEGTANEWLAVSLVDGYGADESVAAVGYGVFVASMTIGRLTGGGVLARWGRVRVLVGSAFLALAGVLLVVVGPPLGLGVALVGAVLWGVGAALGFPTGVSAAADEPVAAAARVSVVSSIAYTAFLAGPPIIGPLSDVVGQPSALVVVLGALVLSLLTVRTAREPVEPGR